MNITNLKKCIPVIFETGRTPHLIGHKGIGKTAFANDLKNLLGYEIVRDLRIGQISDVAELQGLPFNENGVMIYAKPWWVNNEGKKTLIIMDEINRASKDVVQGIFQMVYDKRIGQHELINTHIIALSNPPTDDYITLDFNDDAFQDRFVHIKFEPTLEEFKQYMVNKHGTSSDMIAFLDYQPELVTTKNANDFSLDFVTPSNRSTDYFVTLEKKNLEEDLLKELSYGILGLHATIAYFKFKNDESRVRITGHQVLYNYNTVKDKIEKLTANGKRSDIHFNIIEELKTILEEKNKLMLESSSIEEAQSRELTLEERNNLMAYAESLPDDLFTQFLNTMFYIEIVHLCQGMEVFEASAPLEKRAKSIVEEIDRVQELGKKDKEKRKTSESPTSIA
jgi:hypothetical protein